MEAVPRMGPGVQLLFILLKNASMIKIYLVLAATFVSLALPAQKKTLDSSVYDKWQSIGKIQLSNDGRWLVYNVNVQQGDNVLVIQSTEGAYKTNIPRGYDAYITEDSKTVVFKIKPLFEAIHQAKIKKKRPADMPKDSLGMMVMGKDSIVKIPGLLDYTKPEENNFWIAALCVKTRKAKQSYKADRTKDSLLQIVDSLEYIVNKVKVKDSVTDFTKDNRLLIINTQNGERRSFSNVSGFVFNKKGTDLLLTRISDIKDINKTVSVVLYHLKTRTTDTLLRGATSIQSPALSEDGIQAAFAVQGNPGADKSQKLYQLWYYKKGMDSAVMLIDPVTPGFPKGQTVSRFAKISFSHSGRRLIFGTAPMPPLRDTSVADIDKVSVDIWNYRDDYLQSYQLANLQRDLKKSYVGVYDFDRGEMLQLGSEALPYVHESPESDCKYFIAVTDTGRRIASQWEGNAKKDIYKISVSDRKFIPVIQNVDGVINPSWSAPSGKYIVWYDNTKKNYFAFCDGRIRNITASIKVPLYKEDNDMPGSAPPYGIMGWTDNDQRVLVYDRHDIWNVDPTGQVAPQCITGDGRAKKMTYRFVRTSGKEGKYIKPGDNNVLYVFDNTSKRSGLAVLENLSINSTLMPRRLFSYQPYIFDSVTKARDALVYAYTKENYEHSPNVYLYKDGKEKQCSVINVQQADFNWGTARLYHWKTFTGKQATGILYRPEDFDSTKKYPVILYFYERLSDNLYKYIAPAPTPSRLNISFFVSRGYIVLSPDISYRVGHPAQSAYDYVVSGAQDLAKRSWIDSKHMGIQGQSWGGIQVAQLITMTHMFAAAWAGAPVANMTSAYGGIRWKEGVNRQFQYEKTQSRIGATLWQRPDLYMENSPLFHLPKVSTPLVIMSNDNDGAVPWYQGIELFTAMRRLGKKVWMLNYNGEEHNLVQRKNRKDISIRQQQYFDWLLKGAKPAVWITSGIPGIEKGTDWGLEESQ